MNPSPYGPCTRALQWTLLRVRPAGLAAWVKRRLRTGRRVVATPHGRFLVDPYSHFGLRVVREGGYEPDTLAAVRGLLRPGHSFVDVGANEGYFAVVAAGLVGPTGRVLAVEPQARLHPVLTENCRLNGATNVRVAWAAVSDADGHAALHLTPDVNTGASGLTRGCRYPVPVQEVVTRPLAAILSEHGLTGIDVLKMDIEGYEYEAILGSLELFRRQAVRALILELHPRLLSARGKSAEELTGFLAACGYRPDPAYAATVYVAGA